MPEPRTLGRPLLAWVVRHWTCCGYYGLDHPLPTCHDSDGWIQVEGETWSQRSRWTGKWLLFWPPSAADDAWDTIRWATLGGDAGLGEIDPPELQLGYAAKVADRTNLSRRDGSHTCCVYTGDCRDVDDVQRVLVALRDLGFDQELLYKDDAATVRFIYGRGGALYVAAAGSTELVQLREPIEPLEPGAAVMPGALR